MVRLADADAVDLLLPQAKSAADAEKASSDELVARLQWQLEKVHDAQHRLVAVLGVLDAGVT